MGGRIDRKIFSWLAAFGLVLAGCAAVARATQQQAQSAITPEQFRKQLEQSVASLVLTPIPVYRVENVRVPSNRAEIPVRIYRPSEAALLPVLLYLHGGAWAGGSLETHDNICRYLASRAGAVVVSVDYRRPPEHKFPAALEDAYAALDWVLHGGVRGADASRLVLAGDSAGGGLVAALVQRLKQAKRVAWVLAQVLVNPSLDLRERSASYQTYRMFVDWYLADPKRDTSNPDASPLAAKDFRWLPATFIVTGAQDALRPEALHYAEKLRRANVFVELFDMAGAGHLGPRWAAADGTAGPALEWVVTRLREIFERRDRIKQIPLRFAAENAQRVPAPVASDLRTYLGDWELPVVELSSGSGVPLSLVMLFDRSGSRREMMRDGDLRSAHDFLRTVLRPERGDSVLLASFREQVFSPGSFSSDPAVLESNLSALFFQQSAQASAVYDAIVFGAQQLADRPGRRVVIVFSDLQDNMSRNRTSDVVAAAQRHGAVLYVVHLDDQRFRSSIRQAAAQRARELAAATAGRAWTVQSEGEIVAALRAIAEDLPSLAVLVVRLPTGFGDDKTHRLKITVAGAGLRVQHPGGLVLPKPQPR